MSATGFQVLLSSTVIRAAGASVSPEPARAALHSASARLQTPGSIKCEVSPGTERAPSAPHGLVPVSSQCFLPARRLEHAVRRSVPVSTTPLALLEMASATVHTWAKRARSRHRSTCVVLSA